MARPVPVIASFTPAFGPTLLDERMAFQPSLRTRHQPGEAIQQPARCLGGLLRPHAFARVHAMTVVGDPNFPPSAAKQSRVAGIEIATWNGLAHDLGRSFGRAVLRRLQLFPYRTPSSPRKRGPSTPQRFRWSSERARCTAAFRSTCSRLLDPRFREDDDGGGAAHRSSLGPFFPSTPGNKPTATRLTEASRR